ncbi:endonuclease/exonuclease/phosphatase family protein [Thalassotalea euphylliae]|uniref:endonuclease/exonuclease/phosphatase family protein n=1 Tax=Thalassotalea euphylliae TaxID=1655234 RepID=UPI0036434947
MSEETKTIRIATFNVSMEALNYLPKGQRESQKPTGKELGESLANNHQQIKNIAEIIQRVNPDILLINEFDRTDNNGIALKQFIKRYLNESQHKQNAVDYPYYFQGPVNTGVKFPIDINDDGEITQPQDTYGYGHFPGHFGMALLSKFPIDQNDIRTFQQFKWQDMPQAMLPINPDTKQPYYNEEILSHFRLSSKSHWDIPVLVNGKSVRVLASHPTPPVFDGPEDRNGKRNHDEIRFWTDYITPEKASYIYDDTGHKGGIAQYSRFVILGDLNASTTDGDAVMSGIGTLLSHSNINDPKPASQGGEKHRSDNPNGKHHTAYWGMRADYVLPSNQGWDVVDSGVFWPEQTSPMYRLVSDRSASSDHRLVWVDLKIK